MPVESVRLTIDVSYKSASFEPEEGQHHLYEGMDGAVAQHSRFTGKMFGLPVTFDHQKTVTEPPTASVQFPSGLRMNTIWAGVGPSTLDALSRGVDSDSRTVKAVCHFCSQEGEIQIRPVLPDYLQPTKDRMPNEALLCDACADRIASWDEYGRSALAIFPEDLTPAIGGALQVSNLEYGQLRLWLLSLVWRMSTANSPMWRGIDLERNERKIKDLLTQGNPGEPTQYPVGCVIPSFDGQRLDFWLEPDCVSTSDGPLIRAPLGGIVFLCSVTDASADKLEAVYIRPHMPWMVPVVDWKEIDFLRHWIETNFRKRRTRPSKANE